MQRLPGLMSSFKTLMIKTLDNYSFIHLKYTYLDAPHPTNLLHASGSESAGPLLEKSITGLPVVIETGQSEFCSKEGWFYVSVL